MQSVSITTDVVSSKLDQGEVYNTMWCQWLATGRWFSPGPPVSSTNKTDRNDITEILLKVALNTNKQIKDYYIGICCFSAALRRKSKKWSTLNWDNVSEWSDMSTRGMLFQWASSIKIQLSVLVYCKADIIIISKNVTCSRRDIAEIAQQSLTHSPNKSNTWYTPA
jgi:hypothetical protein